MHQSEVDQQLQDDYFKFTNEPYGKPIPENILDCFEKALMVLPPQSHGVLFSKVKNIISKEVHELSVADINDILKVIVNVSLGMFYDNLFDAIPEQIKLERFIVKFNSHIQEFQEKQNQKRTRLATLSNGILNGNGMRSIGKGNNY